MFQVASPKAATLARAADWPIDVYVPTWMSDGFGDELDRLAGEGFMFEHAYVQIAVCTPSRQVMLSHRPPRLVFSARLDPNWATVSPMTSMIVVFIIAPPNW